MNEETPSPWIFGGRHAATRGRETNPQRSPTLERGKTLGVGTTPGLGFIH